MSTSPLRAATARPVAVCVCVCGGGRHHGAACGVEYREGHEQALALAPPDSAAQRNRAALPVTAHIFRVTVCRFQAAECGF